MSTVLCSMYPPCFLYWFVIPIDSDFQLITLTKHVNLNFRCDHQFPALHWSMLTLRLLSQDNMRDIEMLRYEVRCIPGAYIHRIRLHVALFLFFQSTVACSSIIHHQFLIRTINRFVHFTRRFRNQRAQDDEEKASVMTCDVRSLPSGGGYICASHLPRSTSPEAKPSEPCSPSDAPYDTPSRLVISHTPQPVRKQTYQDLLSSPEHLIVPPSPEVKEVIPNRTSDPGASPAAARPLISVNTKRLNIGYDPSQISQRTPVSSHDHVQVQRPPLSRAATFGGTSDDPLSATRYFLTHRRPTLAVPNSPENDPISRPGSAQSNGSLARNHSNMSLGRSSYRKHDGQAPRPHSPNPSIYEEQSNMFAIPGATLTADLPSSETEGFHIPFARRPSSSDHTYVKDATRPRFAPMSANGVKRFDRHSREFAMIDPSVSDYKIKAYQVRYPKHDGELPTGWTAHVHPEGARYFLHPQSRTYTESDVCVPEVLHDIVYFSSCLHHELRLAIENKKINSDIDYDDVELVLEPKKTLENEVEIIICCYYFVNPTEGCLFWLDEYDAEDMLGECRGVTSLSHKRLAVQAQYWKHWEMFPDLCIITQPLMENLKELMLHATCDHLTTTRSAAALSAEELKQYFDIVKHIKAGSNFDRAHSVVIVGRIMHTFCRNQYLNFHGQPCARLSVDQTVRGWSYKPSIYMTIFAPLLCMAPFAHVRSLHTSFVDDLASTAEWKIFITRLNGQLQNLNLLGTVLLGANVGFLAIQSVDSGGGRSMTQIASYMSLVLSFGSIALGLTFIALDLTGRERGSEAARFLQRMNDGKHGLEKLAIIYSLPYALLMWSMLLFLVAFSSEWCKPGDAVSRSAVGVVLLIVCGLIIWCISVASDKRSPWWWKSDQPQDASKANKGACSSRNILTRLRSCFSAIEDWVLVAFVRRAHIDPPPACTGTRTSVLLNHFRRTTNGRPPPPVITVTTRPDSGVPRTPLDAGADHA